MGERTRFVFECSGCERQVQAPPRESLPQARRWLEEQEGWVRDGNLWWCPMCSDEE